VDPVDAVAELAGTIDCEILTSLGNRFYREYKTQKSFILARKV
jgi:alanine racemase